MKFHLFDVWRLVKLLRSFFFGGGASRGRFHRCQINYIMASRMTNVRGIILIEKNNINWMKNEQRVLISYIWILSLKSKIMYFNNYMTT